MTSNTERYLELIAQKERLFATGRLSKDSAAKYASQLDQIWGRLDDDEQDAVETALAAIDAFKKLS